ncbi:MAG: hypothetical protein KatS3mg115_0004 [Candidatus Poribacteria bacterium]|nr:MAG: hypothetical protein KatS3mg115_0004 [Candidatus Poribacteria bacterium]
MPNQLEAFKIAERVRIPLRRLVPLILISTVLGTLASFWAYLHLMYHVGALTVHGYLIGDRRGDLRRATPTVVEQSGTS